jgi:hypothetical protein
VIRALIPTAERAPSPTPVQLDEINNDRLLIGRFMQRTRVRAGCVKLRALLAGAHGLPIGEVRATEIAAQVESAS